MAFISPKDMESISDANQYITLFSNNARAALIGGSPKKPDILAVLEFLEALIPGSVNHAHTTNEQKDDQQIIALIKADGIDEAAEQKETALEYRSQIDMFAESAREMLVPTYYEDTLAEFPDQLASINEIFALVKTNGKSTAPKGFADAEAALNRIEEATTGQRDFMTHVGRFAKACEQTAPDKKEEICKASAELYNAIMLMVDPSAEEAMDAIEEEKPAKKSGKK